MPLKFTTKATKRQHVEKHRADFESFGHNAWSGHSFILHSYH